MSKADGPKKSLLKKLNKPLASLKLAVFVIISLAVITSIGTFVEAKYDAYAAKKIVYDTWWMYGVMGLLVINLIAVMVDRWPWKRRHAAFVLAHIGIIIILAGSLITAKYGLDGTMRVGIGESNNLVQTAETDLVVYTSFDGDRYSKTLETEVDFFKHPPTAEKPFIIPAYEGEIRVVDYQKYVLSSRKVVLDDAKKSGAGLRFQLQNDNVNVIEWLVQKKPDSMVTHNFGPAQIHLGEAPIHGRGANEVFLT
ncbi:MAG TPA: cytochrome c biogenesis protein, partial [Bdellovibrio sp.]